MARKSSINYAVTSLFSVTARELVDHLAAFCSIKKLAWSPDVKVAMLKKPATNIEEAVWSVLNMQPTGHHNMLQSLLKPIKEHQLFDLADWMRDLNGGQVPDYVQTYWSNNRVPKELDDLVKRALRAEVTDEEVFEEEVAPGEAWPSVKTTKVLKPRKAVAGSKGRGKVAKSDMINGGPSSVAAMSRIAEGQEEIANFLAKGSLVATPKAKAELYRKIAFRSMLAYPGNLAKDDKVRIIKGVPTATIDLFTPMPAGVQQDLQDELKELFKNKAHVNVEPARIEVVLRIRRTADEKPAKASAPAKKQARKSVTSKKPKLKVIKTKAAAPKSKTTAKKSESSTQGAFPFPTSESQTPSPQAQG